MTAEVRRQPFRLYRFYDHAGRLLYIGQTGRMALIRAIEHLTEQVWADDVARWEVDPGEWWTEADVLAAEESAIRAEKPLRNWVHNEGPHRQWMPKVREYRHPSRHRVDPRPSRRPSQGSHRVSRSGLSPKWQRRRNWATGLAAAWLVVTVLAAFALNKAITQPWLLDLRAAAIAGLLPGPALLAVIGRNKRRRDAGKVLAGVVAAAVLLSLAEPLGNLA